MRLILTLLITLPLNAAAEMDEYDPSIERTIWSDHSADQRIERLERQLSDLQSESELERSYQDMDIQIQLSNSGPGTY